MADETRRTADEEEFEVPEDESERGIAEDEDEFEDTDELDDDEDEDDEDLKADEGLREDRTFTSEIGSEGGSQGDMEAERQKPRVMRGSEASTTARTVEQPRFDDRHAGGEVEGPRR
jgi:hypothetical protein